jgi:multiple sugar transport system ATP-binding protein
VSGTEIAPAQGGSTTLAPARPDPELDDGDHDRMAHIVLEGYTPTKGRKKGKFVSTGPSVVEGMVNGTAVRALCGKEWVPGRDPGIHSPAPRRFATVPAAHDPWPGDGPPEGSTLAQVSFEGVTKQFGDTTAVDDLTLHVADGELLVLLGSSGCGKTTALRMVAGLEEVTHGSVTIGERVVNDVDPKDRDVAMVFQSYALYPHLTVSRNIEFPLRQRALQKDERAARVTRAAETLGLTPLLDRKPGQLSGGQRQRVALARAIVREPLVFLMDEPLSNLDAALRVQTRADIVELQARLSTTTLYVTHDQVEAMTMGDRIAVMSEGRLQQVATPEALYARPANAFVAHFLGSPGMNLLEGMLVESGALPTAGAGARGPLSVAFPGGSVALPEPVADTVRGTGPDVVLGLRPEALRLSDDGATGAIGATVIIVELLGAETHVICQTESGARVIVRQGAAGAKPKIGESVRIAVDPDPASYHLFDPESGARLGGQA